MSDPCIGRSVRHATLSSGLPFPVQEAERLHRQLPDRAPLLEPGQHLPGDRLALPVGSVASIRLSVPLGTLATAPRVRAAPLPVS